MSSETNGATGLSGRYATALFDMADEGRLLDAVAGDMKTLAAMIAESDDLRRLLRSPVVSRDEQTKAVLAVARKAGLTDLTVKFLGVVAANRRLFALGGIIAGFQSLLAGKRGETVAEVTSATALSAEQIKALTGAIHQAMGGTVSIDAKVDPGILGGLVVKVGSRMVDSSLSTKLVHLRTSMIGAR